MPISTVLPAQGRAAWLAEDPITLPSPEGHALAEYELAPPNTGVAKLVLRAHVRAGEGGKTYLYAHGRTQGDKYLGYLESDAVVAKDTTLELEVFVSAEMEAITVGVVHRGGATAQIQPPEVTITPLARTTLPPVVANYLDEALGYAKKYALDRDSVDWPAVTDDAYALASEATSPAGAYPAINFTLRRIDRHSFLRPPREQQGWANGNNDNDDIDPNLQYPSGRRVSERMAYLQVPGVSSGHGKTLQAYADSLHTLIARLDGPKVDEWIVDLRQNTGGNCWPMLAGVGPLLGEGTCGYFMRRDGSEADAWHYWNGASWLGNEALQTATTPYRTQRPARVAVLYGPKTASSAEVIAVAFRGRPGARSFGRPTSGYSTGNQTFRLSDGAVILLTVSVYGDRLKRGYGGRIPPDMIVEPETGIDAASEAAAVWLRNGR